MAEIRSIVAQGQEVQNRAPQRVEEWLEMAPKFILLIVVMGHRSNWCQAADTSQWSNMLITKPDDLSSTPETQVPGANGLLNSSSDLHTHSTAAHAYTYTRALMKINNCEKK